MIERGIVRGVAAAWLGAAMLLGNSACTREVRTVKRSYTVSGKGDDTKEMRKRFAGGFSYDDEGNLKAERRSEFEGKGYRSDGKSVEKKGFRGVKSFEKKEYETPEYLKRAKAREGGLADEAAVAAREGAFDANRARESGQRARTGKEGFFSRMNPFKTGEARESGEIFSTGPNRTGTRAQANAPRPTAMPGPGSGPGDYRDTAMSLDDVKRLVDPGGYMKGKEKRGLRN